MDIDGIEGLYDHEMIKLSRSEEYNNYYVEEKEEGESETERL